MFITDLHQKAQIFMETFQLLAATHSGPTGLSAASHVVEDFSVALAHAPIHRQHTVAKTAGRWDKLHNHEDVACIGAQVKA